ncbi:hypothetical protein Q4Q49_06560 [Shewanella sp. SP1S1-7]|uniref:hypothetical protein n=1 Tax=Shewanella sp. SP1S1-7 TaxID=3063536 RepID=UPI00288E7D00|nr:hypothetical protein [Shewanella sp. SP1S1-7]MDT3334958.1 hypothetical protein [Shewanella sp. SP1S1-7]
MSIKTIFQVSPLAFMALLPLASVQAALPSCSSASGGYCQYTGKVANLYVNSGNTILMYFDTPMDPANASVAGFSASNGNAGIVKIDENPEFAKLFYSTALAAQASQRNVSVQMHGTVSGYLKIDRIWLKE